jgi:quinol monooxygenase YgiN
MTTIAKGTRCVTLINVFVVDPQKQQRLMDLLVEATETTMRDLPGFISANIHKSLDGTRVANYAQWRSREDFQAMLQNPGGSHADGRYSPECQSFTAPP